MHNPLRVFGKKKRQETDEAVHRLRVNGIAHGDVLLFVQLRPLPGDRERQPVAGSSNGC